MKIGIMAHPHKAKALELVPRAIALLRDRAEVVLSDETASRLQLTTAHSSVGAMEVDALVAIGGDGTFLSALQESLAPLLPINAGTLGFLAEVDGSQPKALENALDRLVRGDYFLESRMKLAAQLKGANLPDATNEIVVHSSQVAKMRRFEIGINDQPAGRLRGDGVIVATPTGSTSYALSAMGPIIEATVEGILVAALAPFQAAQRAVVIDPLRTISVRLVDADRPGVIVVDGRPEIPMPAESTVRIYRSPRRAVFIRFGLQFYARLRGKKILPWTEESSGPEVPADADLSPPA
ncbi:MAG: NAD(+)/NADH kinase [Thermoplasmata archaeon]